MSDPPIGERPHSLPTSVLKRYYDLAAQGIRYFRERTPESTDDPAVAGVTVTRLKPNVYRAIVLYDMPQDSGSYIFVVESSRELVARWLSQRGLPTVRLYRSDL